MTFKTKITLKILFYMCKLFNLKFSVVSPSLIHIEFVYDK